MSMKTIFYYLLYLQSAIRFSFFFFFFNDTATTEIYTLSLHDALPISAGCWGWPATPARRWSRRDRKSTRLNSSHPSISYAVFCLKKKKQKHDPKQQKQKKNNNIYTKNINYKK